MIPSGISRRSRWWSRHPPWLSVHPAFPAKTLAELIALIRAQPGKFTYASEEREPSRISPPSSCGSRLDWTSWHVPYNGGGPALVSMIAGHTPIGFTTLPPTVPP